MRFEMTARGLIETDRLLTRSRVEHITPIGATPCASGDGAVVRDVFRCTGSSP
jgi:hypothetical protein